MKPRLLILACSQVKRPGDGRIPAIERYNGPLWQTLRVTDPRSETARVGFLSARYGFRQARDPIADYDARLTRETAAAMIAGGVTERWPRDPSSRSRTPRMPIGDHPGMHICGLANEDVFGEVALVGGSLYLSVMRALVAGFQDMGHVATDARIVEINGEIGFMRRDLRAWLEAGRLALSEAA